LEVTMQEVNDRHAVTVDRASGSAVDVRVGFRARWQQPKENAVTAYLIAQTEIHDHDIYDRYKAQVLPVIQKFGGRFIVRGGALEVLEGDWTPSRMVVIEFPSMQHIRDWFASPEYAPLLALRQPAAVDRLVAVEGC
jgi:uncharacterized protein (DUF1330 family)